MTVKFRQHRGFTLVEIMIVVAIVGILSAIAYPAYTSQVAKTRRGTAATCMLEYAQYLERNYTLALRYDQDSSGAAIALPAIQCSTDLTGFYTFAPTLAATTYSLTATPSTLQAHADSACDCALTLNQQGVKGVSGGCSKTVKACWR